MDKITKKERKYYLLIEYSVSTQNESLVRDLHAADVRYHRDCWLGVTVKHMPAGPVQL